MSSNKKGTGSTPAPALSGSIKDAFSARMRYNASTASDLKDIREDRKQDVRSEEDALNFLPDSPYHMHGDATSLASLADTLFLVSRVCTGQSSALSKGIVNTIRSVAFALMAADDADREPSIPTLVNDNIDFHLRSVP